MIRRSVALSLLLAGSLAAQESPLEVQDLLGAPPGRGWSDAEGLVLRSPPRWWSFANMRQDGECQPRHGVSGEGHLIELRRRSVGIPPPRPFLSAEALAAIVAELIPDADTYLRTSRFGERIFASSREPKQLEAGLAVLRQALPPPVSLSFRLERVTGRGRHVLLSAERAFVNGETAVIGDVERSSAVVDFNVEIAQAAATGNPEVIETTYGASVLVRARPIPGTDSAIVELVTRIAAPLQAPKMPGSSVLSPWNRIISSIDEAGLAFRIDRGASTEHEWTALDGSRLRLVCAVDWPEASKAKISPVLCSPLLAAPVFGFRSQGFEPEDPKEALYAQAFVTQEYDALGGDQAEVGTKVYTDTGSTVLITNGARGPQFAQRIVETLDRALAPARVAIEVFEVESGGAPDAESLLYRAEGPVVTGLPSCFAAARERTFLMDWDVEVAQTARIADPKVGLLEEGWFATAKVAPPAAGRPRRVDLVLDLARFGGLQQEELKISETMVGSTENSKVVLPREIVTVERAIIRSTAIGTTIDLDENGVGEVRRAAARLLGPGRELVVRVRVD